MLLQSDHKQNKPGYKSEHNAFAGILKHECGGALVRKFHVASGKHTNITSVLMHEMGNAMLQKF